MKKLIINIIKFIGCLIPIYLASLVALNFTRLAKYVPNVLDKSKNNGFLLSRLRELPDYKNVEYLFLGSSHACREFDPRIFESYGLTSFNLGSSAQTPINSEFLLKEYLNDIKPKQLIFEVYFRFFERDAVESSIDIISNSRIDSYNLSIVLAKPGFEAYNSLGFIGINRLFQPLSKIKQQQFKTDKYVKGGYIEKLLPDSINKRLLILPIGEKINPRGDQLAAFERILKLAKENNVKITLVTAPITQEFLAQFENYNDFNKTITQLAFKYDIPYIDYNLNNSIQFDSYLDFYDTNHLNQKGVNKFNKNLIETYLLKPNNSY